jgi:hypothetical protein
MDPQCVSKVLTCIEEQEKIFSNMKMSLSMSPAEL